MFNSRKIKKTTESGAIMLEVVAVLALMGVMGATLFRQIYQRNQELHNIQMASEIRTVKEAFTAYIQAKRASIIESCEDPGAGLEECTPANMVAGIKEYLPDGWFSEGGLDGAYTFTIWNYFQNDASKRRIVYGVVVPTKETLPTTGWNFKRAARVALLVGADGGAYSSTITGDTINGSLGSWNLDKDDIITAQNCVEASVADDCPTYAAMTGLDIFVPETIAATGEVTLPTRWSLALENLHAYNYFSVGADNDCYKIYHNETYTEAAEGASTGDVRSDAITPKGNNCTPLFWVGDDHGENAATGNVYVLNDLNVGADPTENGNHGLKLTAEGVIKQKNGLTIDADGRIIAKDKVYSNFGELRHGGNYVLDPAFTSTMNDIRLASRGGVRLSDILPNYILKDQRNRIVHLGKQDCLDGSSPNNLGHNSCTITLTTPTCPTDYKWALTVIPVQFGVNMVNNVTGNDGAHQHSFTTNAPAALETLTVEGYNAHQHSGTTNTDGAHQHSITPRRLYLEIRGMTDDQHNLTASRAIDPNVDLVVSYKDQNGNNVALDQPEDIHIITQSYCYWAPSIYTDHWTCEAAGYVYDSTAKKCTDVHGVETTEGDNDGYAKAAERSQAACLAAGYEWRGDVAGNGYCKISDGTPGIDHQNVNPSYINGLSGVTPEQKAAACKVAGHKWTWEDATKTNGTCHD